jgi:GT2 family glycosyltransferase
MSISVIIVNYKTPELTAEAVYSALNEPEATEIIVVENGSSDRSYEVLSDRFRDNARVRVIGSEINLGFGGGNNLAARWATNPMLFLLNSDATFVPGSLATLIKRFRQLENVGILAPSVFRGATDVLQAEACGPFPTAWRLLTQTSKNYGTSLSPDWVGGAGMLIPAEVFHSTGGFDEDIFMYFEDVLLCWRVRRRGLKIYRIPEAGIRHLGGMSYASESIKKKDYFAAQDVFLEKIGESIFLRLLVRAIRTPAIRMQRKLPVPNMSRDRLTGDAGN